MGFSDIIQPGLIQLQPSFDDYMDTLPSLSGLGGMYTVNVTVVRQCSLVCIWENWTLEIVELTGKVFKSK